MRNYFILGLLIIFIFTACSKKENPVDIAIQPELQYVASASTDKTNEQKYKEKLQSTLLEARIP
ncbi:MAG: hypothetical protein LBV52_07340, partial [Spirochaetaceae bacterium]|nr:hypothetical protein [Spirochaetaceae bacterium]